jgi:hypothetical protein
VSLSESESGESELSELLAESDPLVKSSELLSELSSSLDTRARDRVKEKSGMWRKAWTRDFRSVLFIRRPRMRTRWSNVAAT